MTEHWSRPDSQLLIAAYDVLFRSDTPLSKIKDNTFGGRLFPDLSNFNVPGRSMLWKLFLIPTVPLTPPASQSTANPPLNELISLRKEYSSLLLEKMRAPDGSYEDGLTVPGIKGKPRPSKENLNLQRNNPLSLHEDNPWKEWFAAVDVRKTIRQDVERTFPDYEYFRDPEIQAQLTNILYIYSVMHPEIGYRQGMHELLAPLFCAVDYDSLNPEENLGGDLTKFCSRTWVAADAWALFDIVMEKVGSWYEWREPPPPPLPSALKNQYRHGVTEGKGEIKPYVAPIVIACQNLQSQMLKATDPTLWHAMQKAGIEPQIYGIRWLRLLFTREFSLPDAMILWDGIFSCEDTFTLVPWICVAMLIRIRNQLIPTDYSGQLTYLLRYPSLPTSLDPGSPHPAVLLLRQAFALLTSPSASTGSSIAIENRNLLNIPLEVPEPQQSPTQSRRPITRTRSNTDTLKAGSSKAPQSQSRTPPQSVQLGLPELFARGLLEKGESLGINKTVMNAVSEIRKNIPELANQFIRTPTPNSTGYSAFPLVDERHTEERPPWEHRSRVEMEREIAQLRALQKKLGEAVGMAVDALLQDEGENREVNELKRIRDRKREAIENLSHVRDILKGSTSEIDEERLFGEEEYRKRRQSESSSYLKATSSPTPRPPEPAAAVPRTSQEHRRQASTPSLSSAHPMVSLPRTPPVLKSSAESIVAKPVQATAIPRQGSGSPSAQPANAPRLAPWNYTRSNFSVPSINSTPLPRVPPPSSQTSIRGSPQQTRKASLDPLGALLP